MDWHQEVIDHEEDYLIDAQNDEFGMPVPAIMDKIIDKYAPKDGIIEPTKQAGRCKICGTRTGQHGFSFSKAQF